MPSITSKSVALLLAGMVTCSAYTARADVTFERDIRPILKAHCFHCHGEDQAKEGDLDVRLRRFIVKGGESGAAVVPGKPRDSLLLARIVSGEMPPEDVEQRLSHEETSLLESWIQQGAITARDEPDTLDADTYFTHEERNHWSFRRIERSNLPNVAASQQINAPLDRFIAARLDQQEIDVAAPASKTALLRRAYFDLAGVPPTAAETELFLADESPDGYERLLDRLLASPRYGERWGRHWLDVAGYADSEGYTDEDVVRAHAYKYRDYVIQAFNEDLPLDQFVTEQLAGDELIGRELKNLTVNEVRLLEATGFLRMAPDGTASGGVDQGLARNEVVAKTIEIASSSLLGITLACAQCHHHRYDPITQEDYYRFRAIFEPALNWQKWLTPSQRRISLYTDAHRARAASIEVEAKRLDAARKVKQEALIAATFDKELAKLEEALREPIRAARATPDKQRSPAQKKLLADHPSVNVTASSLYLYDRAAADALKKMAEQATQLRATKPREEYVRAAFEPAGNLPKTFLFLRGDHQQPQQELQPAALSVLSHALDHHLPAENHAGVTSGRRLGLARWITHRDNPLFARVMANRIWLHHFGRGIVRTPTDFGTLGTPPSHPRLLDWLAVELMAGDWRVKRLHRRLMTSATYQRSSQATARQLASDRNNQWLGRMPVRRVEAETLRDAVLAVSDQLNYRQGGPAVPVMADRVGNFVIGKENLNAGRPGPVIPMRGEEYRRSIYVQVRRSRPLSVMEPFDLPRMEPNCKVRAASTVAPQALLMMNSEFIMRQAGQLATWIEEQKSEPSQQISLLWMTIYARHVTRDEKAAAESFFQSQAAAFRERLPQAQGETNQAQAHHEALVSLCHAILSSNEFLYVD